MRILVLGVEKAEISFSLIAMKNNIVLVVESKPTYSSEDVDKLNNNMFNAPRYFRKLQSKLCLPTEPVFQRAITFHSLYFDDGDVPSGFMVFTVKGKTKYRCS